MKTLDQIISEMPGRCAVSKLLGYCDAIANSGLLGPELEAKLRQNMNDVATAFDMPHLQDSFERDLQAIKECMERTI